MGESDTFEISSQGDNRSLCARSPVLDDKTWGISGNSDAPGKQCQGDVGPQALRMSLTFWRLNKNTSNPLQRNVLIVQVESLASRTGIIKDIEIRLW